MHENYYDKTEGHTTIFGVSIKRSMSTIAFLLLFTVIKLYAVTMILQIIKVQKQCGLK